jgi:PhnB protein
MSKGVKPIPPEFHTVTPYLVIRDAAKAVEFYKKAFGATERFSMPGPGGKVMHAEIKLGDSIIMIADENPSSDSLGPQSRGGPTSSLFVYVDNVDNVFEQAVKAGCTAVMPVKDQFWGDRYGMVADPFGHRWALATHVEDVSDEEMKKRSEAFQKQMAAANK